MKSTFFLSLSSTARLNVTQARKHILNDTKLSFYDLNNLGYYLHHLSWR